MVGTVVGTTLGTTIGAILTGGGMLVIGAGVITVLGTADHIIIIPIITTPITMEDTTIMLLTPTTTTGAEEIPII